MKKLTCLLIACSFVFLIASCGEPILKEAHDEVVQLERTNALEGSAQQQERKIQVVAENMEYRPNEIRVQPGESLIIELSNKGDTEHNIEFELPEGEKELEQNVQPGESGILRFSAPKEKGTYTIYCPVDDHKEKGMTGKLIVE